jgi:hypothetical protein
MPASLVAHAPPPRANASTRALYAVESSFREVDSKDMYQILPKIGARPPRSIVLAADRPGDARVAEISVADEPYASELVALSASAYSRYAHALARQAERIGKACHAVAVPLLLGGHRVLPGAPAAGPRHSRFCEPYRAAGAPRGSVKLA